MIRGFYKRKQNTSSCASCRYSEYKKSVSGFKYECHHIDSKKSGNICPIDINGD